MREEHQLRGVILKSQPLGEADSLVTWFTQELGKIRTLVVSARRVQSKLGFALQPGSIVSFRVSQRTGGTAMTRLIQATPLTVYVRDFTEGRGFLLQWLQEIVFRATPDEQTNEEVFRIIEELFTVLASPEFKLVFVPTVSVVVLSQLCAALGFAMQLPSDQQRSYYFNVSAGGFVQNAISGDDVLMVTEEVARFCYLYAMPITRLNSVEPVAADARLAELVTQFFEFHIERNIQSSRLFGAILE